MIKVIVEEKPKDDLRKQFVGDADKRPEDSFLYKYHLHGLQLTSMEGGKVGVLALGDMNTLIGYLILPYAELRDAILSLGQGEKG